MKINNVTSNPQNRNSNKNVSFSGRGELIKDGQKAWRNLLEPQRQGNMSRELFTITAFIFLLGGRLFKSRDKNEKRETLTRDIPTILLAVYGVPMFENMIANRKQTNTGFAILNNSKKTSDGIIDSQKVKDWYHLDENLKTGIKGFMDRLDSKGANLKKVVSSLGKKIEEDVKTFRDNNAEFMEDLLANKDLKNKVEQEFKKADNLALKKASFLKTAPKLVGIGITLGLIGLFIPNLNIVITETIARNKKKREMNAPAPAPNEVVAQVQQAKPAVAPDAMKSAQNSSSTTTKKTYANFLGDKK